jgi:hypothetical protein
MITVNRTQRIPLPGTTVYKGERMYYRFVELKDVMRKFWGVGISVSVLKLLDKNLKFMFFYRGKTMKKLYIAHIKQFIESEKTYVNVDKDLQKFVSFKDMEMIDV